MWAALVHFNSEQMLQRYQAGSNDLKKRFGYQFLPSDGLTSLKRELRENIKMKKRKKRKQGLNATVLN